MSVACSEVAASDILDDVAPRDVPGQSISTSPALEASSVEAVVHYDVLEQNVLNVCDSAALAKRAYREAVSAITVVVPEHDVACSRADGNTVVAVLDVVILNCEIGSARCKTVPERPSAPRSF